MKAKLCLTALAAGVALTALAPAAKAVEFPCSTARLIVPWGAGGETDILFRIVADAANRNGADPSLQVVTIGGQGGIKGTLQALEAKPDGCTVFATFQHILASNLTGRIDFTWDAFTPIARLTQTASIIGAGTDAPFDDYPGMQKWAKDNPGELLAGGTLGSTSHFSLLLVQDALGIDMNIISYDGTADRMKAMLANTIHIGQVSEATAAKHAAADRMKLIALNYNKRSEVLPDLKTAREQGFDLDITSDRGIVLPKGVSREVVDYYIDLMGKVANDPEFIEDIETKGSYVSYVSGDEYTQWWKDTNERWEAIARRLGVYRDAS
ncbi:MAG: tripartite tricarboxylate transporter substrate binding protein [Acetobacterales bacterium]